MAEEFELVKPVGNGAFATCFLARRLEDNVYYVLKRFTTPVSQLSPKEQREAIDEVRFLSTIDHPNIIRYYDHWLQDDTLNIVLEFADGGTLASAISRGDYDENQVWSWFIQLLGALDHLHSKDIIHRDLKSANVLLKGGKGEAVKLGDFGLSKQLTTHTAQAKSVLGTPYYLSPEICNGVPYDHKSDIWALGCILYELVSRRRPFEADNIVSLAMLITNAEPRQLPVSVNPVFRRLILWMLKRNPRDRPSIAELFADKDVAVKVAELKDFHASLDMTSTTTELPSLLGLGKTEEAGKAGADAEVIGSAELDSRRAFAEDHYRDRHPNVLLWGAGKVRPTLIEDLLPYRVADVSIGAHHWVARTVEGCVFSVGSSPDGALGLGNKRTDFKRLTLVPSLRNAGLAVTAVSCGPHTTTFIANGALFITGELCGGTVGSLGLILASTCAASSGSPLALTSDSLASSVSMRSPAVLASPQGFDGDGFDTSAASLDANVFTPMMVTAVPAGTVFKQVACASGVVISLDSTGRVWSWGTTTVMLGLGDSCTGVNAPTLVTTFLGASLPDSSASRSSKSRSKKAAWAPLSVTPAATQISVGEDVVMAVDEKGRLFAWGLAESGRLGIKTAGSYEVCTPTQIPKLAACVVTRVSCGRSFCGAITEGDGVWLWGSNKYGQCGPSKTSGADILEPQRLKIMDHMKVEDLSCGDRHTLFVAGLERTLWAMGSVEQGRLGIPSLVDGYGMVAPEGKGAESDESDDSAESDGDGPAGGGKLDDDYEFGGSDVVPESMVARTPVIQGSVFRVMFLDAGKWDDAGTSIAVTAPVKSGGFATTK